MSRFSQNWISFFDKPAPNIVLRLAIMALGMVVVAFGIALSRATNLGVTAISAIPNVLSLCTPLSLGTWTFTCNVFFVLTQIALARKDFKPLQLLCVVFVFFFSATIDLFVPLCQSIPMESYAVRMMYSIIACFFIAAGVDLQARSALVMLPGDGIVVTISTVFRTDFAKTKLCFDVSNITIAALISLAAMHGLYGVREGSVIAAVFVGLIIKLYHRLFPWLERCIPTKGHPTLLPNSSDKPDCETA